MWALLVDGVEIKAFRGPFPDELRELCEEAAIERDLAARLPRGVALAPGVEIVCYSDW